MKLNHLNLTVTDVPAAQSFLANYFGLKTMSGNKNMGFLTDDNGMILTLMSAKVGGETEVTYPGTFHIGFIQESEAEVNELNQRLKDDGYEVPLPSRQHGSWTFYFTAPGNVLVEVLC